MSKPVAIILLIVAVVLMVKFMEPTGPRTASAVGNYSASENEAIRKSAREIAAGLERYSGPTSCTTTSYQGPYKWDGMTYSTVCK